MKSEAQLIIESYGAELDRVETLIAGFKEQKRELHDWLESELLSLAEQSAEKVLRLELDEWRDDSCGAFQVAQSAKVIVVGISYCGSLGVAVPDLRKLRFTKTGKLKLKQGKPDTAKVRWNAFASWRVVDHLGQEIFGFSQEPTIIPDYYSAERLETLRKRLAEVQAL